MTHSTTTTSGTLVDAAGDGVIADLGRADAGPTLIAVGAVHGNEPAGAEALESIGSALAASGIELKGRFLALRGHVRASEQEIRFIDVDLNRVWSPESVEAALGAAPEDRRPEQEELARLHRSMTSAVDESEGNGAFFMDLHTTSSESSPFVVLFDSLACRRFALEFPVPIILGLEEHVGGTLADFALTLGCVPLIFEAGQHEAPQSPVLHEAACWIALRNAGIIDEIPASADGAGLERLHDAAAGLPRFVEIIHHHPITAESGFRMNPGFENFADVEEGLGLAQESGRALHAPCSGLIFMPLYQKQGDDGYFIVRPVSRFWLWLSRMVRRAGVSRLAHLLPGVHKDPGNPRDVLVDPKIARFVRLDLLHLLGYRRIARETEAERYRRRD